MWNRKKIDEIEQSFPKDEVERRHNVGREKIKEVLDEFTKKSHDDSAKDEFWHRWSHIREMIQHINDRVDYWEARRTQFLQIGIGLLAASIAGVIAILDNLSSPPSLLLFFDAQFIGLVPFAKGILHILVLGICVCFTFGSLHLLFVWNKQTNPNYPFTKGYRTWVWHYRHAEQEELAADVEDSNVDNFHKEVEKYSRNLIYYKTRILQSNLAELLDQDLSQVYLLLTNEKFKIKMVSRLRDSLLTTTWFALITSLMEIILLAIARVVVACSILL